MNEPDHAIGVVIRRARLAKGWTADELARAINLSTKTILSYESGIYRPSRAVLGLMAKALGASLDVRPTVGTALS
jgi:transcriptional regulator with XRE-family HTH domain